MHDDAELPCCPVVGVLPPVPDVIERPAELDGDALGIDADIEITRSVPTCPRPQVSVELLMQVTEERVREDIGEHESPVGDVIEQRDADLIVDRLLGLVKVDLLRLIAEDLTSLWGEGVCLKRSTRSERVTPTGTDLFSNAADARVERIAAR
nr:hypothetical protein [Microbacterium sp. F2E]